ncbi:MAG: Rieske (2Fe-2S) protein [Actinomycetes bacterium]
MLRMTHACVSNPKATSKETLGLSRRNFFSGIAVAAGSLGLTALATSAQAASKKYKVCETKAIKVGGGSIFNISAAGGIQIMITQPKAGVFRAFNPACTHQGYRLNSISGTNIICPIHRAQFDTTTGNVTRGPAQIPLQKYTLTVENKNLFVTLNS